MARDLKELFAERGLKLDAVAVLGEVDKGTISRIANGKSRAKPETIVRLARGLGISARRMQALCDAAYLAADTGEPVLR